MRPDAAIAARPEVEISASPADSVPAGLNRLAQGQIDASLEAAGKELAEEVDLQARQILNRNVAVAATGIGERIGELERNAALQLRELASVQDSLHTTAKNVGLASGAIDRTLQISAQPPHSSAWMPALLPADAASNSGRNRSYGRGALTARLCPNCGSREMRRSAPENIREEFLSLLFIQPLRCGRCLRRYLCFAVFGSR